MKRKIRTAKKVKSTPINQILVERDDYAFKLEKENKELKQELIKYRLPFLKVSDVGEWTEDNRKNFQSFMTQGLGEKLAATLRNWAVSMNTWAVQQPANNAYYCGMANGFQIALTKIDEHSQLPPKKEEAQTPEDKTLEDLGYFHARSNGRSDDSLERLRP